MRESVARVDPSTRSKLAIGPPFGVFNTADETIVLAVASNKIFKSFQAPRLDEHREELMTSSGE